MKEFSFKTMFWSWSELILLLLVTFLFVPIVIENLLQDVLYVFLEDSLYSGTLTGLVMSILFTGGVYVIALRPYNLSWRAVGFNSFQTSYWKSIITWTVFLIGTSLIIVILMELLGGTSENTKTQSLQSNMGILSFLFAFVSAAIISPIYEEIFYRGFLYRWFRVKLGVPAGILLSSSVFMLVHIPSYNTLPVNFLTGVIFSWTYEKTGSIYPGMIIHGVFNGIAVVLTALS
ncbi:CPBP family intramembrane glutamic endopeptidase [Psychrobacillus psychrodurans]|uniref:CPBP family intramembrane glutamic endopeptidase n=1 Tax=Psychrobacillus psychrodurans TaxID=126157 RepID=UPI003D0003AF